MPNLQLANYANLALYAAMVALTVAMLTFAVYVAFAERPRRRGAVPDERSTVQHLADQRVDAQEAVLVGAGARRTRGAHPGSAAASRRATRPSTGTGTSPTAEPRVWALRSAGPPGRVRRECR